MAMSIQRVDLNPRTVWRTVLQVLVVVLAVWIAYRARVVVVWTLLAVLLALALTPGVDWLERYIRRSTAVLLMAATTFGLVLWLLVRAGPELVRQLHALLERVPHLIVTLRERVGFDWIERHVIQQDASEVLRRVAPSFMEMVRDLFSGAFSALTVVTLAAFMLAYGPSLFEPMLEWFHPHRRAGVRGTAREMADRVGRVVMANLTVAVFTGVFTSITMAALRAPFFLPVGLLCAFLSVIPYLGSAVTIALVALVALATRGIHAGIVAAVVLFAYFQLKDKLLDPLLMRRALALNPLLTTEVLLVATALAGVAGALLALPLTGALQVFLRQLKERREARWRSEETELLHP